MIGDRNRSEVAKFLKFISFLLETGSRGEPTARLKNAVAGNWLRAPIILPMRMVIVSTEILIGITDTATEAFKGFDWSEHDGKGVRLYVQGFG